MKKAKQQNENSSALEEMVANLSEAKVKWANDNDNLKRSELKLQQELEHLNNKYDDLETDWNTKDR